MAKKVTKKQEKTIERMKKARKADNDNLRDLLNKKLSWVKSEKAELEIIIENLRKRLDKYEELMLKLKGAEIALSDVLGKGQDDVWQKDTQE